MDPGDLIAGKYRVLRQLGEGGMGRVLAARHEHLDQTVAVKVLLDALAGNQEVVSRFLREARAAVKLRSEHVGKILDVGTLENGAPYIVMEFLEGRDLQAELGARQVLPVPEATAHILQTCEALAEAHLLGIVHRDIKPANLYLTHKRDGGAQIKVLDFGISKVTENETASSLTRTQTIMGSPGYMSPEQLRSTRDVDARTDVWSLGVVLYELLSGSPPWTGENFSEICLKVGMDPVPRFAEPRIPEPLMAVIFRCLEKKREDRFQNVAELAAALAPFAPRGADAAGRVARVLSVAVPPMPGPPMTGPPMTGLPMTGPPMTGPPMTGPPMTEPPAAHLAPTTLSSASGYVTPPPRGRIRLLLAGGLVGAVAIIGLVWVLASGNDSKPLASPPADIDAALLEDAAVREAVVPPDASPVASKPVHDASVADATSETVVTKTRTEKSRRDRRESATGRRTGETATKEKPEGKPKNENGSSLYDQRGPDTKNEEKKNDKKNLYDKRN